MSKIYVGNLSWSTTDENLRQAFEEYGRVLDSVVMRDRETGRSRGFGFVTYDTHAEADTAIATLNDQELDGRRIKVNLANARSGSAPQPASGGFGGYGGKSSTRMHCMSVRRAYPNPGGGYAGGGQGYPGYGAGFGGQGGAFGHYPGGQQGYQGGYGGYQQQPGGYGY